MSELIERLVEGAEMSVQPSDLSSLEDQLILHYLPAYEGLRPDTLEPCLNNWEKRERLYDLIRGKKFRGDIIGITISLQTDPAQELIDSRRIPSQRLNYQDLSTRTMGIVIRGQFRSSALSDSGKLEMPVWYTRTPRANVSLTAQLWKRYVGLNKQHDSINAIYEQSTRLAKIAGVGTDIFSGPTKLKHSVLSDGSERELRY